MKKFWSPLRTKSPVYLKSPADLGAFSATVTQFAESHLYNQWRHSFKVGGKIYNEAKISDDPEVQKTFNGW